MLLSNRHRYQNYKHNDNTINSWWTSSASHHYLRKTYVNYNDAAFSYNPFDSATLQQRTALASTNAFDTVDVSLTTKQYILFQIRNDRRKKISAYSGRRLLPRTSSLTTEHLLFHWAAGHTEIQNGNNTTVDKRIPCTCSTTIPQQVSANINTYRIPQRQTQECFWESQYQPSTFQSTAYQPLQRRLDISSAHNQVSGYPANQPTLKHTAMISNKDVLPLLNTFKQSQELYFSKYI